MANYAAVLHECYMPARGRGKLGVAMAKRWIGAMALCLGANGVAARDKTPPPPPAEVQEFSRCRAIAEDPARLRCFDAAADRLQAALTSSKVYVLDRTEVQKTRRSLFGLPLPKEGVISESIDDANRIDHLEGVVASASQGSDGSWRVTLDTGSTWQQVDDYSLGRGARRGDKVEIRRGALGSFRMKIGTQAAVRARRVF